MSTHQIIEKVLLDKRDLLKKDYNTYRNHVYRVFHLCLLLDNATGNADKYAIASIFHDIGIWTDLTFDYLKPSIAKAQEYLQKTGSGEWEEEVSLMIDMHHKLSSYKGPYEQTVETFRRADWIDVTKGVLKFGLEKKEIATVLKAFPALGFHAFLLKQSTKNFFKHPLNPLPMFKK
jgi:hypothetical protein